jgi:hypothetical protein
MALTQVSQHFPLFGFDIAGTASEQVPKLIDASVEPTELINSLSCLVFVPFRHPGRLIFVLILRGPRPAEPDNKCDEAQQPPSTPSNSFCGFGAKFHWNSNMAIVSGNGLMFP